jgi:GTP-binding protein
MDQKKIPIIAIVGRPNVGKSTFFNRLIGQRKAIESEYAGTTRDRITHKFNCSGYETMIVDTGGLEFENKENIEGFVQLQARLAIQDADIIVFMVSGNDLLTSLDYEAAELLRKSKKEVIFVANKCDSKISKDYLHQFYELGFGEPIKVSAIQDYGIDDFENKLIEKIKFLGFKKGKILDQTVDTSIKISFIGKPNVGKSSLINAFFNEERVIVSEISGTTRDSIDLEFAYKDQKFVLIDTAGIRRPGKRKRILERFSVMRSIHSVENCDIALLILDYKEGIGKQDCHVSSEILDAKKGLIFVINKSDLMENVEEERNKFIRTLQYRFPFIPWAPVVFVSAINKKNVNKILDLAIDIMESRKKRIETSKLNDFIAECVAAHPPTSPKSRRPKILYLTQVDVNPPHFIFFVNNKELFHFSYFRYLEKKIREEFNFVGTAIRMDFRSKPKIDR